jgi:opacity protein-like surface antigen
MRRRRGVVALLALVCLLAMAAQAQAGFNLTGFLGTTTAPTTRGTQGLAVAVSFVVVGVEFEYAAMSEDVKERVPASMSGMFNVMVQTPIRVARMQFYGTVGAGVYSELLTQPDRRHTNVGLNYGGGVNIRVSGPLRARLDYRLFNFNGSPRVPSPQRFYAGLGLAF